MTRARDTCWLRSWRRNEAVGGPPHLVGFLASALRAPAPKPTKCDTIPSAYLFSRKWFTSIDITEFDRTRRLTIKRRTLSIMRHSAVQQPSPPALTVPRWPVDSIAAWVRRSQDTDLDHAACPCNRPSEPGQGSSTRRGRAATWSMVARFSWRNTTESDLTLKMFTHFSQTVVLTRGPP